MALGLKDLLREPAPIREEGINLCHCGQQPGRNCMPLGTCLRRAGVGVRVRRGGCFGLKRLQRILKQSGAGQKNRVCMYACTRACALGLLGKLDAASLLPQHLRACVRAH